MYFTVWKILDFSVTHIFREINFKEFKCPKTDIFTLLRGSEFDFHEFLNFLKAEFYPNLEFRAPKIEQKADFELLHPPKLISRKI